MFTPMSWLLHCRLSVGELVCEKWTVCEFIALSGHFHGYGNGYSGYWPDEDLWLVLTIIVLYSRLYLTHLINNVQCFIQIDEYTKKSFIFPLLSVFFSENRRLCCSFGLLSSRKKKSILWIQLYEQFFNFYIKKLHIFSLSFSFFVYVKVNGIL